MAGAPQGLEEVTDGLYALDPDDFVAARNELVRRLRNEGDRQLAAVVGTLRRPTPAAWAVNQLARRHRGDLEDLVRLGEELRAAQERALAGEEGVDLRQAGRARRESLARLAELAERILAERGAGAGAHAGEVTATLEAASLDAAAASEVLVGHLSSPLQPPSGFGVFDLSAPESPQPSPAPQADPAAAPSRRKLEQAQAAATEARSRWEERAAKARTAVERVGDTRRTVQEAEAEVGRLEDELAQAARRLRSAVRDAEQAEDAAARAEDAAAKAAQALREAERRVADLAPT